MHLPRFEHFAPQTVAEACALLAAHGASALPLAGGTDLIVKMKSRKVVPGYVVNLKGIPGLDQISFDATDGLRIGALVTIQALKNSVAVKRNCRILADAAAAESSVQIRNIATLGGNIANASPAADAPLALIAAGATVVISRTGAQRVLLLEDFCRGPGQSVLEPGEIVTEIRVPPLPPHTGAAYVKHAVRQTDISIVGVGVVLSLEDKICSAVRVALGSVAPTIIRARSVEALVAGKIPTPGLIAEAARLAGEEASPIDDIRQSALYRKQAIAAVARTALSRALENAKSGGF